MKELTTPSTTSWTSDLPLHWQAVRASTLFVERNVKGNPKGRLLAATQNRGVIPKEDMAYRTVTALKNFEQFKQVRRDDFVISLRSFEGGFEHSSYEGIISPAYFVFFGDPEKTDPRFWRYVFKCSRFLSLLKTLVVGIRDGQTIRFADFKYEMLPLPPIGEQRSIANYLDRKAQQIDTLIEKKRKLIELLREERQALINQAVTKGLDRNVKLKSSGIEWLGDVPEHWEIREAKHIGRFQNGVSKGAEYFGTGYPFVGYGDVYSNAALTEVKGLAQASEQDRHLYSVRWGDILFTRTSETIEEIGFASTCVQSIPDSTFSGFLIRFRPSEKALNPHFSKYYFRSNLHRPFFVKEMNLVTRASLSQDLLGSLAVLLPPLEEQQAIATLLDEKVGRMDSLISSAAKSIELLSEYRTSLITEAVTGKLSIE